MWLLLFKDRDYSALLSRRLKYWRGDKCGKWNSGLSAPDRSVLQDNNNDLNKHLKIRPNLKREKGIHRTAQNQASVEINNQEKALIERYKYSLPA